METKKTSLYDLAKKAAPKKATPAKDVVVIKGISKPLIRLTAARNEVSTLKAEITMLEGELKPIFHDTFIDMMIAQKSLPESFTVTGDEGGKMLVIVQDKYLSVDDNKAEILAQLDKDLVSRVRTLSFDPDMMEKHEAAITAAILGLDIPQEDMAKLLKITEALCVPKGTIKKLLTFADPKKVYGLIQPILQLKG